MACMAERDERDSWIRYFRVDCGMKPRHIQAVTGLSKHIIHHAINPDRLARLRKKANARYRHDADFRERVKAANLERWHRSRRAEDHGRV